MKTAHEAIDTIYKACAELHKKALKRVEYTNDDYDRGQADAFKGMMAIISPLALSDTLNALANALIAANMTQEDLSVDAPEGLDEAFENWWEKDWMPFGHSSYTTKEKLFDAFKASAEWAFRQFEVVPNKYLGTKELYVKK